MAQVCAPALQEKWIKGLSPDQPLQEAAHRILGNRLDAVWQLLPLAAERSEEDIEYVHQLRVSSRRAVEGLRVFRDLLPDAVYEEMRVRLRQVRLAANDARNLDVLHEQFACLSEISANGHGAEILEQLRRRRQEAQWPIVKVFQEFVAGGFDQQVSQALSGVLSQRRRPKRTFARHARRCMQPVLRRFFQAAGDDLSSDEALHNLRIHGKRLRYTMEIVARAFAPGFRKRLYPRIKTLQDVMGTVNDHATAKTLFDEWLRESDSAEQRAFFRGILVAEARAHRDMRQAFLAIWTPQAAAELRRRFEAYVHF